MLPPRKFTKMIDGTERTLVVHPNDDNTVTMSMELFLEFMDMAGWELNEQETNS